MMTDTIVLTPPSPVLDLGVVGRRAAQAAAALTGGAAVSLAVFFTVGQPWGTINDCLSIALAGATMPIAIGLARRSPRSAPLVLGAGLDVIGVAIATAFTSLLITGRMTFAGSLQGILSGQALIGCWILLVGLAAWSVPDARRIAAFAIAGGAGLIATAVGIAVGGMGSPVALYGFVAGLIGTAGFYALLGRRPGRDI